MPNTIVPAAVTGLPQIDRRRLLVGLAAASTAAATATVAQAAQAAAPAKTGETTQLAAPQANPEFVSLFSDLKKAVAEKTAAKDAREWIIDEWRHRWPPAPDEITLPGVAWVINDEVDLAGRPLVRPGEKHARRLYSLEDLAWSAERTAAFVGKARNDKSRAARLARAAKDKRALHLGEAYYREVERIKDASGIRLANARIKAADHEIGRLSTEIMDLPASSLACLAIKAEAAEIWGKNAGFNMRANIGPLGWAWRLTGDILNVTKGASA
ncbi:hypothetical protein [Mesorhizobium sp. ANAO-SY3R2]|uniref:hypothetical protein n=1 Tax=Mesorhizobium sp. ANAO-SY3R2 TaxID=3166644 RepID=UPI00366AAF0D